MNMSEPLSELSPSQRAQACKELMRNGSKSFFAASRILPLRVRDDATVLYAFCRVADDAIDNASNDQTRSQALIDLRERLANIYAGTPMAFNEDVLLAPVVLRHNIPQIMLEGLLEGFAWDAQGRRYETLEQLHDYAARVAGTVGAMMALIMGARSPSALARACELGAAMQLTNIARDVGEDARAARLYLPLEWFAQAGLDPQTWLAAPTSNPVIQALTERLLVEADRLYQRSNAGIAQLPADCRTAIRSAARVYAEIGQQVRRNHLDSVTQRAVVSTGRKIGLITLAACETAPSRWLESLQMPKAFSNDAPASLPGLRATQFLLDSVIHQTVKTNITTLQTSRPSDELLPIEKSFYARALWVLELSERVAQRNSIARTNPVA